MFFCYKSCSKIESKTRHNFLSIFSPFGLHFGTPNQQVFAKFWPLFLHFSLQSSKMRSRALKRSPRHPKKLPKRLPRCLQDPPRGTKDGPKTPQEAPKTPPGPSKIPQDTSSTSKKLPGGKVYAHRKDPTQIWYYFFLPTTNAWPNHQSLTNLLN